MDNEKLYEEGRAMLESRISDFQHGIKCYIDRYKELPDDICLFSKKVIYDDSRLEKKMEITELPYTLPKTAKIKTERVFTITSSSIVRQKKKVCRVFREEILINISKLKQKPETVT